VRYDTVEYETIMASDLERDGMMLEVWDRRSQGKQLLEVFFSDVTGDMSVNTFGEDVPLGLVEMAIAEAKRRLPPKNVGNAPQPNEEL